MSIIIMLREMLDAEGYRDVKIFGPETMTSHLYQGGTGSYVKAIKDNAKALEALDVFATHGYEDGVKAEMSAELPWRGNIWMGVTVESAEYKHRIDYLRYTGANIKFLSLEPMLGDLGELNLDEIDWVIVGGESGPGARPMEIGWVRNVREQCLSQKVPFFFKQWGGINKKKAGRFLDGETWDEMPICFRDNMYA